MISEADRKRILIAQESTALKWAGDNGPAQGAELARLTVDGVMNALIRIEGPRAAAEFAFAVADRTTAGIRGITEIAALPAPKAEPAPPEKPKWKAWHVHVALAVGLVAGILIGIPK